MSKGAINCSCVTCGDEALDMAISTHDAALQLATCVDADGNHHEVDLGLVDGVRLGTHVLVHAGTAIAIAPQPRS
jgi:hydrogenase maturation factor